MELWSLFQEQILGMKWLNEWLGRGLSRWVWISMDGSAAVYSFSCMTA